METPWIRRVWIAHIHALEKLQGASVRVTGVIAFPHMSNFTDFDALAVEPSVALAFVERAADAALADVLILPGVLVII